MGSVTTQTPLEVPSSERVETGSFPLKLATFPSSEPTSTSNTSIDAQFIATTWVDGFNKAINSPDAAGIPNLFLCESYWRDQLCLSWDFHCLNGLDKIVDQLKKSCKGSRIKSLALDKSSALRSPTETVLDADGKIHIVQSFLTIETDVGNGAGIVRLARDDGTWKVFTLFTFLKELKGHEELIAKKRPLGVEHGEHVSRENWLDRRNEEKNFERGEDPAVLIIGKWGLRSQHIHIHLATLTRHRGWTSWPHHRRSTEDVGHQVIDYGPRSPNWR
jgi:hypothetical protein